MSDPNYITPEGAKRLAVELDQLLTQERPKVVDVNNVQNVYPSLLPTTATGPRMRPTPTARRSSARSTDAFAF